MKQILILFSLTIGLTGCSKESKTNNIDSQLTGNWKLVEVFGEEGAGGTWASVEDGYTYTFKSNGSFESTRFDDCTLGNFIFEDDNILSLNFSCEDFTTGLENQEGKLVENAVIESNFLILTPIYLNCAEGCDYKFEKLGEE